MAWGKFQDQALFPENFDSVLRCETYCQTQHLHCCLYWYGQRQGHVNKIHWFWVLKPRFYLFLTLTCGEFIISFICHNTMSWLIMILNFLNFHRDCFSPVMHWRFLWQKCLSWYGLKGKKWANFSSVYVDHASSKLSVNLGSVVLCVQLTLYCWSVSALEVYIAVVATV